MSRRPLQFLALAALATLVGVPATTPARGAPPVGPDHPADTGDAIIQIRRPITLAAGDRVGSIVVVSDTATVDGTVSGTLVAFGGGARVRGTVGGNVVVLGGRLVLEPGARVGGDVELYRSTLERAAGSVIAGGVHAHTTGFGFGERALVFIWLSMTIAVVAAGLLFAAVGGDQLDQTVALLRRRTGEALLGALAVWVGLPALAIAALSSVVGIPIGLGILLLLLPALWFVGYLVAGTLVGMEVLRATGRPDVAERRYAPVMLGLAALQLVGLIPALGGLATMLAGFVGAGAVTLRIWSIRHSHPTPHPASAVAV